MGIVKEQWFMGWYARGFHIDVLRTKTRKPHTIHSGADGRRGLSSGFAHGHTHSPRALGPIEREQDSHPTTPTQKGSQKYRVSHRAVAAKPETRVAAHDNLSCTISAIACVSPDRVH